MIMARKKYTSEQIEWLRENAPGHYVSELIIKFKELFGLDVTDYAMRSLMHKNGIRNCMICVKGKNKLGRLTTPEQDAVVREKFHDKGQGSYIAVQEFLLSELGIAMSMAQVKGYLNRKKIRLGTYGYFQKGHEPANKGKKMPPEVYEKCAPTMFRKGNRPQTWKPVGTERVGDEGYVIVKVAEPNKWKFKSRIIWERETGEHLTSNDKIIFLDGNKLNLDVNNLAKVSCSVLARMNQNHLFYDNQELTKVGITIARLMEAKGRLRKK